MLLTMNASVPLADKFHKNTGKSHICNLFIYSFFLLQFMAKKCKIKQ